MCPDVYCGPRKTVVLLTTCFCRHTLATHTRTHTYCLSQTASYTLPGCRCRLSPPSLSPTFLTPLFFPQARRSCIFTPSVFAQVKVEISRPRSCTCACCSLFMRRLCCHTLLVVFCIGASDAAAGGLETVTQLPR